MVTVLVSFHLAGGCVGGVDHNRLLLGLGLWENGKTYNGEYTTAHNSTLLQLAAPWWSMGGSLLWPLLTRPWLHVLRGNGKDTMQCC